MASATVHQSEKLVDKKRKKTPPQPQQAPAATSIVNNQVSGAFDAIDDDDGGLDWGDDDSDKDPRSAGLTKPPATPTTQKYPTPIVPARLRC